MKKWIFIILSLLCVGCAKQEQGLIEVSIEIRCDEVLQNEKIDDKILKIQPEDGVILKIENLLINEKSTVFDVLKTACAKEKIHMEFVNTPIYNSAYIEGINNLYEFDAGNLSGWKYSVNGEILSVGVSNISVKDNDEILFFYVCDGDF